MLPGFDANSGSEVHIYNAPTFLPCSEYTLFHMPLPNNNNDSHNSSIAKEIELSFIAVSELDASVIPNPSTGEFRLELSGDYVGGAQIIIENMLGETISDIRLKDCNVPQSSD